jgi:type IV pilus assembly protein PilM
VRSGFRTRPWAGLDVGSFSVKLLATQGSGTGGRYWLGEHRLPERNGDGEAHSPDVVAKAIGECFSRAGLSIRSCRGISVGVGGPDVIVKQITLPLLDEAEVAPALRFEARKHLPFDPQTMIIDFQVLGRYTSERKLEVLLAAVSQGHAEQHLAPFKLLGVEPDIVDPAPLALVNAITADSELQAGARILLDFGDTSSHLMLYQRGQPFFTRRLDFGGRHLTQAIAEGLSVSFEEAEEWKLTVGADEPGLRMDWSALEMQAMLEGLRGDLVDELRRSFAFYRTLGQLPDDIRLWISGGSARLPGLAAQLSELLEIPVMLFDPLDRLPGPPRGGTRPAAGPHFAQAFGLATRTA